MVKSEDLTKKRLLSVACHASIFLSATLVSVGIPLAIYFISDDETVKENALIVARPDRDYTKH